MGTRSLTVIVDEMWPGKKPAKELAVMYRQFDGYLSGHGKDLKEFLDGFVIVNGMSQKHPKLANGGSCLAAQVIAHFKTEPGEIYLYEAGARDCGEEFIYTITASPDQPLRLAIDSYGKRIFDGTVADFDPVALDKEAA